MKTVTSFNIHTEVQNEINIKQGFYLTVAIVFVLVQVCLCAHAHMHCKQCQTKHFEMLLVHSCGSLRFLVWAIQ